MGEQLDAALTPDQRVAAILDAQGFELREITRTTGLPAKQVAEWRTDRVYAAEVDRLRESGLADLQDTIRKISKELLDAASLAVEALTSALTATKDNGEPDWYVIQRAAETILHASSGIISPKQARSASEAGAAAAPFTSITVNLDGSRATPVEAEVEPEPEDADVVEPRYINGG